MSIGFNPFVLPNPSMAMELPPPAQAEGEGPSLRARIRDLVDNPSDVPRLQELLSSIPASEAFGLLEEVVEDERVQSNAALLTALGRFVCSLEGPDSEAFLTEYPVTFAHLLTRLPLPEGEKLVKVLMTRHREVWRGVFWGVFGILRAAFEGKRGQPPRETEAGLFARKILVCLPERRRTSWLKFCGRSAHDVRDLVLFLLVLEGKDRLMALRAYMRGCLGANRPNNRGVVPFLKALGDYVPHAAKEVRAIARRVVDKCSQSGQLGGVLTLFDSSNRPSVESQVVLLDALPEQSRMELLKSHSRNFAAIAAWMNGLFQYNSDFPSRRGMLEIMCDLLHESDLTPLLAELYAMGSELVPYFLFVLSDDAFDDFLSGRNLKFRSDLLCKGVNDSTRRRLLGELIKRRDGRLQRLYAEMHLDVGSDGVPVDPAHPLTLSDCFQQVLKPLADREEFGDAYASFMETIPPVMIGVAVLHSEENREIVQKLASLLSCEQLQFFTDACFLLEGVSKEQVIDQVISPLGRVLKPHAFDAVLGALRIKQLNVYASRQLTRIQKIAGDFEEKYRNFTKELNGIEGSRSIQPSHYESLVLKSAELHGLSVLPDAPEFFCTLERMRSRMEQESVSRNTFYPLDSAMKELSEKRSLFVGRAATVTQRLERLRNAVESDPRDEEDLTQQLYEGFWSLMREGVLPYLGIGVDQPLGIVHAGELIALGIRSNRDLGYIGISPGGEKVLGECKQGLDALFSISKAFLGGKVKSEEFNNLLEEFTALSTEEKKLYSAYRQLTQLLIPSSERIEQAWALFGELSRTLSSLEGCGSEAVLYPNKLKNGELDLAGAPRFDPLETVPYWNRDTFPDIESRELPVESRTDSSVCLGIESSGEESNPFLPLFGEILREWREKQPLSCLQRYLRGNADLKQSWTRLSHLGYPTVSSLFDAGRAKEPSDLLRIKQIAAECASG